MGAGLGPAAKCQWGERGERGEIEREDTKTKRYSVISEGGWALGCSCSWLISPYFLLRLIGALQ